MTQSVGEQNQPSIVAEFEQRVAQWIRHINVPSANERDQTENGLLRCVLDFALLKTDTLFATDGTADLVANLLARAIGNCFQERLPDSAPLASLAALVYAGAGNFATAGVFARQVLSSRASRGPIETWLLKVLSDRSFPISQDVPEGFGRYASLLDLGLDKGDEDNFSRSWDEWSAACRATVAECADFDRYVLLMWRIVHKRVHELSAARTLNKFGLADEAYLRVLRTSSSPLLFPSQANAIEVSTLLSNTNANALVLTPTSTGKTLLGELAILASLSDAKPIGVYLAPYRALADQIVGKMRSRLGHIGVKCLIRRGGYLAETSNVDSTVRTVIIATPEAFDTLVRSDPALYSRIACCVFDEFHLVEQAQRGIKYEGLAARILEMSRSAGKPRLIALSPVLSNSQNLQHWLRLASADVAVASWRPTGRRLVIVGPDMKMLYFTPGERSNADDLASSPAWVGSIELPHAIHRAPAAVFGQAVERYYDGMIENVVAVAIDQYDRFRRSVLIISATRAKTRVIAAACCSNLESLPAEHVLSQLADEITSRFPYVLTLPDCLRKGVCYHNASLPNWVREKLEYWIERGELRIVVATTTLAEGVDLPFRSVVLSDWQQYRFGKKQAMPSLLFRNIAGRCGRAGVFAEGDTVIVDHPPRDEGDSDYEERLAAYINLYVYPPEVAMKSSLEYILASGQESAVEEVQPGIESQFTAYLDVRADSEEQADDFSRAFLGSDVPIVREHLTAVVDSFTTDLLVVEDFPLLARNSPIRLTELGRATSATGLSPRSILSLARFIQAYTPPAEPRAGKKQRDEFGIPWNPLVAALIQSSERKEFVSELNSIPSSAARKGAAVLDKDRQVLALGWIAGLPLHELAELTLGKRGGMANELRRWFESPENNVNAEEQVEDLSVFCDSCFTVTWVWVCRSAKVIADAIGNAAMAGSFEELVWMFEFGVSNALSAVFLKEDVSVDRSIVDFMVRQYATQVSTEDQSLQSMLDWFDTSATSFVGLPYGTVARFTVSDADRLALRRIVSDEIGE